MKPVINGDVKLASIDNNQIAVPNSVNPKICFSRSIHLPGCGRNLINIGNTKSIMYGRAKPIPINKNIKVISKIPLDNENPIAVPRKGAEHGVAKRVANAP